MGGPGWCSVVPKQLETQADSIDFRRLAGCKMRLWNQTRVMAMEAGKEGPHRGYRRCRQAARRRQRNKSKARKDPPTVKSKQKKRRCESSEEMVLARRATHGCCDSIPDLSTGGKGEASNHYPSFILACRCHTTSAA